MKSVVADVFQRFLAAFPTGDDACLLLDAPQSPDAASIDRAPYWTVLVRGRHDGKEGPHSLVLLTAPSRAADSAEVLEFAVRRARAHKAPYFVTWTLRDAILWRTPKPGVPVFRDAMEKLRDYPDLFEVGLAGGEIAEPVRVHIVERGREITRHLETLLKHGAVERVPVLDEHYFPYFKYRLTNAFKRLVPAVEGSVRERLMAEARFREKLSTWGAKAGAAALRERFGGSANPESEQTTAALAALLGDPVAARFVAEIIVFRLVRKILTYHKMRCSTHSLRMLDLDGLETVKVRPALLAAFAEARGIEPHAGLDEDLPDRIAWPARVSEQVKLLVRDLNSCDFNYFPQRYIEPLLRQAFGGKRKPKRGARAENKIRDDVARQLLPAGRRRFPQDFVPATASVAAGADIELPDAPLIFEDDAFFTGVRTSDNGFKYRAVAREAKYLLYAHYSGHRRVALPGEPVELTRAVANYEKYLRQLRDQLYDAYLLRTFDARIAERLTLAIFERFVLPAPDSIG